MNDGTNGAFSIHGQDRERRRRVKPGEYVAVLRMGDSLSTNLLVPVALSESVSRLWVVRPAPAPASLADREEVTYVEVQGRLRIVQLIRTLWVATRLARRPATTGLLSFNAMPYGLLAVLAGRISRKPVHVGFVGTDAEMLRNRWYGRFVDALLRRASFFTVPGRGISDSLVSRGYANDRIAELPHAVDLSHWTPLESSSRPIDFVFVGRLVTVKQVHRIVESVAIVRDSYPEVSLVIVGSGPEEERLEGLVDRLDLRANVSLVGFQEDLQTWYRSARFIVIASLWEGFPFVLVEGMCSGVVPVAARVGSIPDVIEHAETGYLFDGSDPDGLVDAMEKVLGDVDLEGRMREMVLKHREHFGYAYAARLWANWHERMS